MALPPWSSSLAELAAAALVELAALGELAARSPAAPWSCELATRDGDSDSDGGAGVALSCHRCLLTPPHGDEGTR